MTISGLSDKCLWASVHCRTCCFVAVLSRSVGSLMVASWERQKVENDFRHMTLNGLFRDASKGWSFDVQPPGIKSTSEFVWTNRSSTVSMERVHHKESFSTWSMLDPDLSNPHFYQITIHPAFILNTYNPIPVEIMTMSYIIFVYTINKTYM